MTKRPYYHYTKDPFELDLNKKYLNQIKGCFKPFGLWVSDDSDFGWKEWCEGEEFKLDSFSHRTKITIKNENNIYFLRTLKEMKKFNGAFSVPLEEIYPDMKRHFDNKYRIRYIDWSKVKDTYGGLVISPYQHFFRLDPDYMWYCSWDCASGCIWDLNNIDTVEKEVKNDR